MARTENDTWDLASSVGATATAVAAQRAIASRGPEPLLNDPFADPLVRAVGSDVFVKLLDNEVDRSDDPLLNRQAVNEQITVRTRYFDDFFMQATGSGVRQAVILASGLDTRAYRLPWPAGTVVYEIDQPEVIEFKTRVLADLGAAPAAERRTVAIDLRDDWPAALVERRVRRERADGLERRRPARLPAGRGTGPFVRQHRRVVCAGQPDRDRTHGSAQHPVGLGAEADRAVAAPGLHHQFGRTVLHRRPQHRRRILGRAWLASRHPNNRSGLCRPRVRRAQ